MKEDTFPCRGYGVPEMTPERCLANQLSPFCLPGWPCETCEEGVGVVVKGTSFWCGKLQVQVNQGLCYAARFEARRRATDWPEGLGWLEICLECDNYFKKGKDAPADWGKPLSAAEKVLAQNSIGRDSEPEVGQDPRRSRAAGSPNPPDSGAPALKPGENMTEIITAGRDARPTRPKRLPDWWWDATPAVRRSYEEG